MKIETREIIEIIGIFSVVASLMFVGLQLMLDRRVATGAQFHERSVLGHESNQMLFNNSDWIKSQAQHWENGFKPRWWNSEIEKVQEEHNLSMEDMVRTAQRNIMEVIRVNNNYFQYQQGLISQDTWDQIEIGITRAMDRPMYRAIALDNTINEKGLIEILQRLKVEVSPTSRIRL